MSEKLERFTSLMKEIFELDKSDLDFGIYRVMNLRKEKIEQFLDVELPKKVQDTLAPFAQNDKSKIQARMDEIESQLGDSVNSLPDTVPMVKEYHDLQKQLAQGADLAALETDVYSALYSFFNRYYDEGDFVSKRRYKEGVYAIPYEGEEVKLYWANQDQYYIKTSENFKDYTFLVDDYSVHFRLVDATTEQNNNKETKDTKRFFMLFEEDEENYPGIKTFEFNDDTKELIIRFVYDIQNKFDSKTAAKKWAEYNYKNITSYLVDSHNILMANLLNPIPTGKGKETTTLLEKQLNAYVAKNTFDYFIHKDLRGFLSRELDFYIKSEIMHLDDIDTENEKQAETYIAKIRAIKRVGKIIIDFLAQIEDFQKKLWLKKKFVVETNWCITLDKIDESFWKEIINNTSQIDEWIDMYAIDEADGWTNPPSVDFLRQNLNLVVDTKHFATSFKENLIASIDDLENEASGLIVHTDNYQGIRLLKTRYKNSIKCLYIDPPYNAKSSEILYKNTYKNSSWLSLMSSRIEESKELLSEDFVYDIAIDEIEQELLGQIISQQFPQNKKICVSVVHNPRGQQGKNVSYTHEFAYMIYPDDSAKYLANVKRAEIDSRNLRDSGTESDRTDAATCFYPFIVKDNEVIGIGNVPDDDFHPESNNVLCEDGTIEIWPIDDNGNEKKWRYSVNTVSSIMSKLEVKKGQKALQIIFNQDMGTMRSLWSDSKYDASEYGTKLLQSVLGSEYVSRFAPNLYPKSIHTELECISVGLNDKKKCYIMDFFAGSGTTGHAVISLNRELDKSEQHKYILMDMGSHFSTVLKPRIKKVVYSKDWKDGKPTNRNTGLSQIVKCLTLESYEDALSNIEMEEIDDQVMNLFGEDYLIKYMIDLETKGSLLNLDSFNDPFAYEMKITEKNECKKRSVDVVETFNYLIGLNVTRQGATSYFRTAAASESAYEGAVDLVKDDNGEFGFKQIEGVLPDGKRALVIWRTVSGDILKSNATLDAYFTKYRINPLDREYDVIFVNGDNNLENLRTDKETWKVQMTEIEFKSKMFEEE